MNQCNFEGDSFEVAKEMHRRDAYLGKRELWQESRVLMNGKEVDQKAAS